MGLSDRAKRIDDAVLGRSDTTRGFAFNALSGLHPALTPIWFAVAVACLIAAVVAMVEGRVGIAVAALVFAGASAFMGFVARGVPAAPTPSAKSSACSWCESDRHEMCTGQAVAARPQIRAGWSGRGFGACSCSAAGHASAR